MRKKLRLILGDQLNHEHSWFNETDSNTIYLIAELKQELDYVNHHIQKILAFFSAMKNFAHFLKESGHQVIYLTLDDTKDHINLESLLKSLFKKLQISQFQYQRPDEYRLLLELRSLTTELEVVEYDSEHFLFPYNEIPKHFAAKKHKKMEFFYRYMRKRFNILMEDGKPIGAKWNFDSENRQSLKKTNLDIVPPPKNFANHIAPILERVERHKVSTIGKTEETISWPVTREQSLELLNYFCQRCLSNFGRFQDAMTANFKYGWSLFHSRLSFALNSKLISPAEVIHTSVSYYMKNKSIISLAQIEGFVRQILGWREFVRCIYWANMPDYAATNQLKADRDIPKYFWNGNTDMNCIKHAVNQSMEFAYAHHIQRLMITGNFALITGLHPDQVDRWYLGIYIDAIEWVEMPNTRGMALFADEGIIATKPYAAGGNYINKMSDYCNSCKYNVKTKTDKDSCPFNSLYWHFMNRHRELLSTNPRTSLIFRNWDNQSDSSRQQTLKRASWLLDNIENL